jgi:hypothetical protein
VSQARPDPLDQERRIEGELPDGVDPLGVPQPSTGYHAFLLTAAAVVALLALIFTLSWVVYHQLTPANDKAPPGHGRPTQGSPTVKTPVIPTA